MFAYSGALLVGGPAIGWHGQLATSFFLCTILLAALAVIVNVLVLYPRGFKDPPKAETFADDVAKERVPLEWARAALLQEQVRATKINDRLIEQKVAGMKAAIAFSVAATLSLFLQVMAKEGYIGG